MTIELDHFDVFQKQLYVIIATAIGLFTLSYFHYPACTGQAIECKDTRSRRLVHGYCFAAELRRGSFFMLGSVYTAETLSRTTVAYGKSQGSQQAWGEMRAMSLEKK